MREARTEPWWRDWAGSALGALALVAAALVFRAAYLILWSPYELVEDEAHYWLWSRHIDWSYYTKGPGVAWAIWVSTKLCGDAEWAVRLPAAVMSALGGACVAGLAWDVARPAGGGGRRGVSPGTVALYATAAVLLAPAVQAVGVLMTIDGPYLACWAAACWAAWRAMERGSRAAWIALGLAIGAGFLFKYTMLLLAPGLLWHAWLRRGRGDAPKNTQMWVWACAGCAALGLLPVLIWNAGHDWVTVRHLLGHMGLPGGDVPRGSGGGWSGRWSPFWSLELIGMQVGMIGPGVVMAAVAIGQWGLVGALMGRRAGAGEKTDRRSGPRVGDDSAGKVFLACAGLPVLVFYLGVSFMARPEGNWPLAAWVTLLPLGGWWAAELVARRRAWGTERGAGAGDAGSRRPRLALWHATIVYGVVGAALVHRADVFVAGLNELNGQGWFRSAFASVVGREPRPLSIGRVIGSEEVAVHAVELLDRLKRETGLEPFVLAKHYGRASQIAYELHRMGRDTDVLCAMEQTGGRKSQFDIWPHTSLARRDLIERPALIISNDRDDVVRFWESVFESVELLPENGGRLRGEHKVDRFAFLGRGYRGWRPEGGGGDSGAGSR